MAGTLHDGKVRCNTDFNVKVMFTIDLQKLVRHFFVARQASEGLQSCNAHVDWRLGVKSAFQEDMFSRHRAARVSNGLESNENVLKLFWSFAFASVAQARLQEDFCSCDRVLFVLKREGNDNKTNVFRTLHSLHYLFLILGVSNF